mmetsp:Transcript_15263/g.29920  ORF Transcript_15263/g.29920 Transcript_15263/m.29920 type:complete len:200 (+) Transcript_15263:89-688(+)
MLHFQVLEALGEEEERVPKRIVKEIALIEKYREKIRSEGIMMVTKGDKRHFFATIDGPADSPYAGGKFHLEMYLLEGYPFKAPKVRFLTPIYHPNIDKEGRISLDVLQDNWSPALSAFKAVYCIRMLLYAPNPDDPLDCKFAAHWKQDMTAARQRAQEWVKLYASDPDHPLTRADERFTCCEGCDRILEKLPSSLRNAP